MGIGTTCLLQHLSKLLSVCGRPLTDLQSQTKLFVSFVKLMDLHNVLNIGRSAAQAGLLTMTAHNNDIFWRYGGMLVGHDLCIHLEPHKQRSNLFLKHWNEYVIILTKFLSLAAPEVVKMTSSNTASDENFIKMTFPFIWAKISYSATIP